MKVKDSEFYVYVVKAANHNIYKIGRSHFPDKRVHELGSELKGVGMGDRMAAIGIDVRRCVPCTLLLKIHCDPRLGGPGKLESFLKWKFVERKIMGEWFYLKPDDLEYIRNRSTQDCREHIAAGNNFRITYRGDTRPSKFVLDSIGRSHKVMADHRKKVKEDERLVRCLNMAAEMMERGRD